MFPTGLPPSDPYLSFSSSLQNLASSSSPEKQDQGVYFSQSEIATLLQGDAFVDRQKSGKMEEKWAKVILFRSIVSSALNAALSEILSPMARENSAILEIGSGIGYELPENLSRATIRIQPSIPECQSLVRATSGPVYQLDIEGLYYRLINSSKKIPLIFALNVFDTMPLDKRKISFSQTAQLQNPGDRLVLMLDTNPLLEEIIKNLEMLHPDHVIFPYFPLLNACAKWSVIIVPQKFVQAKPTTNDLLEMIEIEAMALDQGQATRFQAKLHALQEKYNLKVVCLEDYFAEMVSRELEEAGYKANVYYQASFTTGEIPRGFSEIEQDLIYKAVTDIPTIKQWSLSDKKLIDWLNSKGLKLPNHFEESFLEKMRNEGKKIYGAEILVIEAIRI